MKARSARRDRRTDTVYTALGRRLAETQVDATSITEALREGLRASPDASIDVWRRLAEVVDPALFCPKLAADVEVKVFHLRWGNDYAMAYNPRDFLHFRLQPWEAKLLELMDGTRTVADIIVERLREDGDLDASAVTDLVLVLQESGFLDPHPLNVRELVHDRLDPASDRRRKLRTFLRSMRVDWSGADRFFRWWYRYVMRWFFSPVGATLAAVLAVAGLATFVVLQLSGRYHLSGASAAADSLVLIALGFVLTFAHELAHASVIVHNGRSLRTAGVMIYFGSTAFFVEASDSLMLERGQRILQSFAGPFAELVLSGVSSITLALVPAGTGLAGFLYKFSLLNYFVIFLNLVPLLELDGYWVLADVIQVPDLRPRSLEFAQHDLWHKLRTRTRITPQELGLGLYALLGILFTILCFYTAFFFWRQVSGKLLAALWNGGWWGRILLLALIVFLGGPMLRGLVGFTQAFARRARKIWRRIVFRLEKKWRIEAAELIDALPAFEDLPGEVLSDLAGRVHLRSLSPGQPVFRQGDRADAFYVVRTGTVRIEEEDPDSGKVTALRTLGRGDSFGELGLVEAAARTATARAVDSVELFQVDKGAFDHLLAEAIHVPEFAPTLQAMAELRELPPFATLGSESVAELLRYGEWLTVQPGTELIHQGDAGDSFYAIRSGQADVLVDGERARVIGPDAYFGEIALLQDVPRTATVVARTPMRVYRLEREGFDELVKEAFSRGTLRPAVERTEYH